MRDATCQHCGGVCLCRCNEPEMPASAWITVPAGSSLQDQIIRAVGELRDSMKANDEAIRRIIERLRALEAMTAALQNAFNMRHVAANRKDD